jgi:hypothetical protein
LAGVVATEKTKGLFVTTSSYTEGAIEYAAKAGIELWNFNKLAELISKPELQFSLYSNLLGMWSSHRIQLTGKQDIVYLLVRA